MDDDAGQVSVMNLPLRCNLTVGERAAVERVDGDGWLVRVFLSSRLRGEVTANQAEHQGH